MRRVYLKFIAWLGGFKDVESLEEAAARYRVELNAAMERYSTECAQLRARALRELGRAK